MHPLVVIASLVLTFSAFAAESVLVGVLEEPQCAQTKGVKARVMFQQTANGWITLNSPESKLPSYVTEQTWTIAFDGRRLGSVTLSDPNPSRTDKSDWTFTRDKLFVPKGDLPVRASQNAFAGWCDAPTTRPLVLLSHPLVSDPAGWKPFRVPVEFRQRLYGPLRKSFGTTAVVRCRDSEGAKEEAFRFKANDLKVFKGYKSKSEGILISIGLDPKKFGCDGPPDANWSDHWFHIRGDQIKLIGIGLELVDSGDYDGDGASEILFWKSAYNRNGYALVFNNFRKVIEYVWSYH